jgi:hypothetical protein
MRFAFLRADEFATIPELCFDWRPAMKKVDWRILGVIELR